MLALATEVESISGRYSELRFLEARGVGSYGAEGIGRRRLFHIICCYRAPLDSSVASSDLCDLHHSMMAVIA